MCFCSYILHMEEKYLAKKKVVKYGDGLSVKFMTLNRLNINTVVIDVVITLRYSDGSAFIDIKNELRNAFNEWLRTQEDYSYKNKIFIFESPQKTKYISMYNTLTAQFYLSRVTKPEPWKATLAGVLPFGDIIADTIKKTCDEAGLTLCHKGSMNPKMNIDYQKNEDGIPNGLADFLASGTSKPYSG